MAVSIDSKGSILVYHLKSSFARLSNFHPSYNDACKCTPAFCLTGYFQIHTNFLQKLNKYLNTLSQKSTLRNVHY